MPQGGEEEPFVISLGAAGLVVDASGIDGFFGSSLDVTLRSRGVTHLVLAGFGLEGPVHSTLRSANDRGYECLLLADASAAMSEETKPAAISTVEMSGGIFGAVGELSALRELLGVEERMLVPAAVAVDDEVQNLEEEVEDDDPS
jgi:nicotinamidase-related amidase